MFAMIENGNAQNSIPLDTTHWDFKAQSYILEQYKGKDAIYIQNGQTIWKDAKFLNGTIEFDVFLTERQAFPGVFFRQYDGSNAEAFFLRPHLSGKPDANQASPIVNGIQAYQLYFGPMYSFPYTYSYDDWTHVKVVVNHNRAQVYLDHSEKPHLSWYLKNEIKEGIVSIGGSFAPMHFADIKINTKEYEIVDFEAGKERKPTKGIVRQWQISDKFEEGLLKNPSTVKEVIKDRKWGDWLPIQENIAVDISRRILLRGDGVPGNTVFAKITIDSEKDQTILFDFGYSDRAVVILNGNPIYKGTNKWRSRDYRYLGTIGFFDSVYLDLKKGDNTLLMAISEDFGGWLVTGKFNDYKGIKIK